MFREYRPRREGGGEDPKIRTWWKKKNKRFYHFAKFCLRNKQHDWIEKVFQNILKTWLFVIILKYWVLFSAGEGYNLLPSRQPYTFYTYSRVHYTLFILIAGFFIHFLYLKPGSSYTCYTYSRVHHTLFILIPGFIITFYTFTRVHHTLFILIPGFITTCYTFTRVHHTLFILIAGFIIHYSYLYPGSSYIFYTYTRVHYTLFILIAGFIIHFIYL